MDERCCLFLGIILCLALVSESGVIVPRALPEERSSGNGELPFTTNPLEKDKKLGLEPIIRGPSTRDDDFKAFEDDKRVYHPRGPVHDYEYFGLDRRVDNIPEIIPERFPSGADPDEWPETKPKENDDTATDDDFKKKFDEEYPYRPDNNDKDLEPSPDENDGHKDGDEPEIAEEFEGNNNDKDFKPKDKERPDEEKEENDIPEDDEEKSDGENDKPDEEEEKEMHKPKDDDDDDERLDEEEEELHKPKDDDDDEEMHKPKDDDERPDDDDEEEEMHKPKDDDEKNDIPEEEPIDNGNKDEEIPKEVDEGTVDHEDEESIHEAEEAELSSGGSIFDNPFFNLEQVKKYFSTLERALGHVFRQTVDEAILLNGTYANTTEEEVEIDGKKYIITKSVIKGGDNHSSLYVESLSSKPKMNDSEIIEDIQITNVTRR